MRSSQLVIPFAANSEKPSLVTSEIYASRNSQGYCQKVFCAVRISACGLKCAVTQGPMAKPYSSGLAILKHTGPFISPSVTSVAT